MPRNADEAIMPVHEENAPTTIQPKTEITNR